MKKYCTFVMMKDKTVIQGILLLMALLVILPMACLKKKDAPKASPPDGLTNHYCNDPRAVNFNRDFPGIPDSSVCVYPVDAYLGQWQLYDSVFYPDGFFKRTDTDILSFTSIEDSTLTHLKIEGFCSNNQVLHITTDKYGHAKIDSMNKEVAGQLFCTPADTVTGTFEFLFTSRDTMLIELKVIGPDSSDHKGMAIKL